MTTLRRTLVLALLCAPWWARAQHRPVTVAGVRFERRAQVAGTELRLNGVGVRAVAWFKGYAAALYLSEPATTAAQAVDLAGPKRLRMHMLHAVPPAEFIKAFRKGVQRNALPGEMPRLAERMGRFEALIEAAGTVQPGDVVDMDLDPARGLLFSHNGRRIGEPIAGTDFFGALLRGFVGERPYDKDLRAGLLGG